MTLITTAILVVLNLTATFNWLPTSWQNSLWHQTVPTAAFDLSTNPTPKQPVNTTIQTLNLDAKGVIAVDADSGTVLYAKDADRVRPIASIVKIATVLTIVRTHSLDETVTITAPLNYPAGAVALNLQAGQKFKLSQLLAATLIPSANDAADALAVHDSGSVKQFTVKANQLLKDWGVGDMVVADANGLSPSSQASPRALAKLAELALTNPDIARLVDKAKVTVNDLSGKTYPFTSTNLLLSNPAYSGIKTGYTFTAGQSFVSLVEIKGHRVITVVLSSPDRFGETETLVKYLKTVWEWQ